MTGGMPTRFSAPAMAMILGVHANRKQAANQNTQRAGDHASHENAGDAVFDRIGLRISQRERNRQEVGRHLGVDGKERRQRKLRGDIAVANLGSDKDTYHLSDYRARAQNGRKKGQGTDKGKWGLPSLASVNDLELGHGQRKQTEE